MDPPTGTERGNVSTDIDGGRPPAGPIIIDLTGSDPPIEEGLRAARGDGAGTRRPTPGAATRAGQARRPGVLPVLSWRGRVLGLMGAGVIAVVLYLAALAIKTFGA